MQRQFTSTVYIVDEEREQVLLIFHRKLNKWLPPGGHLHSNEIPPECAKREAYEETGLEIEFILQENVWVQRWNANSFERPFLCLLEEIPAFGEQPAHQHVDLIYVAKPKGGSERFNEQETAGLRWFSLEELERLETDVELFGETLDVIRAVFREVVKVVKVVTA